MIISGRAGWGSRAGAAVLFLFTLLGPLLPCSAGQKGEPAISAGEELRLGERMYRDGVLPSGQPMQAVLKGDSAIPGLSFACVGCHLRGGLGFSDEGVVTPPATGNILYRPYRSNSPHAASDQAGAPAGAGVERPAYNRESLARVIRTGVDSAGRTLNDIMPRYRLADPDMAILIGYLERLSAEPSPGASAGAIAFAAIITDDVSREDREALLLPLQQVIAQKNQQMALYQDFLNFGYNPGIGMEHAFRLASLEIWDLKGPPEAWPGQLAAYYDKKPVFAVLGGISNGDWRPIHDFCEARHLPCLFPITDLPVVSETGWYSYYFNKGYFLEGEAVARYLNGGENLPAGVPILQIVQDSPAGRALASGFQRVWSELERPAVTSVTLSAGQLADQAALGELLAKHKPGVLLIWSDASVLPALPALAAKLPAPGRVFLSSSYLGKKSSAIAEPVRDRVYLSYPYRLTPFVGSKVGSYDAKVPIVTGAKDLGSRRIATRTGTMLKQVTLPALNLLYDNLYRDHLLDLIGMQMDLTVRDYERLSFGFGERYVSRGCYIVQLGPGAAPALLPRSDWAMP